MSQIAVLSRSSTPQSELTDRLHHLLREAESEYASLLDDSGLSCPLGSSCTHAGAGHGAGHGTHSDSGISSLISKIGEDLKIARRQYRKALLQARQNSVQQQAQPKRITNEKVQQQDVVVAASSDVTAALRRTQQLMHAELQKSRFVTETLEESTEALKILGDRYQAFDNMLGKSKELIRELVKKNKSDKWYYETAIKMLVGMFIWIIIRRLLWGPIILLIVWPVKMVWWTGGTIVGLAVGDKPRALSRLEFEAVGTTKMESMVTIQTQSIQAIPTARVVQRVEPVRISPAPSQGAEEEEIRTMTEIVANIIDDSTTTILPNTRSRRFEDPPAEVSVEEHKSDTEPVAPATTEEAVPEPIAATEVDEVELRDALNEAVRKQEGTEVEEPSPEVEPTVERKHDEL
jgi:uncharacterized membrane protein